MLMLDEKLAYILLYLLETPSPVHPVLNGTASNGTVVGTFEINITTVTSIRLF